MIRKSQLFLAIAALAGMNAAMAACNISQWGQFSPTLPAGGVMVQGTAVGTPTPGNPTPSDADGVVSRYSGACGLKSSAAGNYVQDGSPSGEAAYIARFYVYTGNTGEADVFHARSNGANAATDATGVADDYNVVRVTYDAGVGALKFYNRSNVASAPVTAAPNKWFAVELAWTRSSGELDVVVRGGSLAQVNPAAFTGFSVADNAHGVDYARLGWISGGAGGPVYVDAFESRRSTPIGRLCRGNANANVLSDVEIDNSDSIAVRNEVLSNGATLAGGNPDCNEDGEVGTADQICIRNYILADNVLCSNDP